MSQYQFGHDPLSKVRNVEGFIEVLREFCLNEADHAPDTEMRSLYETSASVLGGLSGAFQNYLMKGHVPWESFEDTPQRSTDPWD